MLARFQGAWGSFPTLPLHLRLLIGSLGNRAAAVSLSTCTFGARRGCFGFPPVSRQRDAQLRHISSSPASETEAKILYSRSHEYLRFLTPDGPEAAAGISEFASKELGEIVFVESVVSVEKGEQPRVARGDPVCTLEAVKSVAEVYAPVSGRILGFNKKVKEDPGLINRDPEGEGWIFTIAVDAPQATTAEMAEQSPQVAARSSLLSPEAYAAHVRREIGKGAEN